MRCSSCISTASFCVSVFPGLEFQQFLQQAAVASLWRLPCFLGRDFLCCLPTATRICLCLCPGSQPHQFCVSMVLKTILTSKYFLCCQLDSCDLSSKGRGNTQPQPRLTAVFICTSQKTVGTTQGAVNFSFQLKLTPCKSICPVPRRPLPYPSQCLLDCVSKL